MGNELISRVQGVACSVAVVVSSVALEMATQTTDNVALFKNLSAEDGDLDTTEIESYCVNCGENGMTRLLLTKIPLHKEIILMSFSCSHCGFTNNETQFGGKTQAKGVIFEVLIESDKDLDRQVVKTDYTTIKIPELNFEIPAVSQKGEVTTIEGVLERAIEGLKQDQIIRKAINSDLYKKIKLFIPKLEELKEMKEPFHFVLDDPSGNGFVENLCAPNKDPAMKVTHYARTLEQEKLLGLVADDATEIPKFEDLSLNDEITDDEVLTFITNCPSCNAPCNTNMKVTKIPHFKEVIIIATNCDVCGNRTNEVKSGSGTEPLGKKMTLRIIDPVDMTRDVIKSATCSISIPELEFEMGAGALGGRFSTVEGLLTNVKEQLLEDSMLGDSVQSTFAEKMKEFCGKIDEVISCKREVHFVLDDPAGNSYLQSLYAPEPDPELKVEYYERSFEQNDDLGLNDMKTENY